MSKVAIFNDLFVLEVTNNHKGSVERGMDIIKIFSDVVKLNKIKNAAIKFQFRQVDEFIHKRFKHRSDMPYAQRILETQLSKKDYSILIDAVRQNGCMPMATPFDEESVSWCVDFDLPIIKIASVDSSDWFLLEKVRETKKPLIVSAGGTSLAGLDQLVEYFKRYEIPLAINHCIASYPTEAHELELDQIDFLRLRYPDVAIGLSSHEYSDWSSSMLIAYAKGVRLFERHVDVGEDMSLYSSAPNQIDTWFKAYAKAKSMCGDSKDHRKTFSDKERLYLDTHIRGVYAAVDLHEGQVLSEKDVYLAIPLQKKQLSTREVSFRNQTYKILKSCRKDDPVTFDVLDISLTKDLRDYYENRGAE